MKENQSRQDLDIVVILPDVRSVLNVGSIFRTSDAVGVSKIYLCGYTPTPIDRFGRQRQDLHKAALGAELDVSWEHVAKAEDVVKRLKDDGYKVYSVEQDTKSKRYDSVEFGGKVALIFGNEVSGLDREVLDLSDEILEIPMFGKKESLNISVSAGIILYKVRVG